MNQRYTVRDTQTARGALAVGEWSAASPPQGAAPLPMLALHGASANHLAWAWLADQLPHRRLIAPDLKGRGGSAPSNRHPSSFAQHADDMAAVLDALEIRQVDVVGHSMGGFVAVVFAHRHPARVGRLVLVDGGLPLVTKGSSAEDVDREVLAGIRARLALTFPSRDAAVAAWRAHPAFAADWSPQVAAYADYDLFPPEAVANGAPLGSRVDPEVVAQDNADLTSGTDLPEALRARVYDTTWLTAPRGLLNQPSGELYPPEVVSRWRAAFTWLQPRQVPDVNHYTILMSRRGAAAVAAELG